MFWEEQLAASIALVIIVITVVAAGISLQFFFSRSAIRWLGLVLPCFTFLGSIVNMVITATIVEDLVAQTLFLLLFQGNIPTIVLLLIYFGCRENQRRKKLLEKMNIQDLD